MTSILTFSSQDIKIFPTAQRDAHVSLQTNRGSHSWWVTKELNQLLTQLIKVQCPELAAIPPLQTTFLGDDPQSGLEKTEISSLGCFEKVPHQTR